MKGRITICCNSFPPEKGGAPSRIYNLARLLRQHGYEVTVITAMPNYPTGRIFPGFRGKILHRETVDGIRVLRLWLIPSNSESLLNRGLSLITFSASLFLMAGPRLLSEKPRLVIVSSPPLVTAYAAAWLSRITGCSMLLNISDIWPLSASELGALRPGLMLRVMKGMEAFLYRRATAFMGQSEEILEHIRSMAPMAKPFFLYRNLPANGPSDPEPEVQGPRRILYAGLLGVAQGVLELCRSVDFAALGTSLHIYGDGMERAAIADLIMQHPGRGIYLHPTVPQEELERLLSGFQAMLIPLKTEIKGAVPSKLFLAVTHRMPVLFCGGGEGAGLVHRHQLGWTSAPGDYEALVLNISIFVHLDAHELNELRDRVAQAAGGLLHKAGQDQAFLAFLERILK